MMFTTSSVVSTAPLSKQNSQEDVLSVLLSRILTLVVQKWQDRSSNDKKKDEEKCSGQEKREICRWKPQGQLQKHNLSITSLRCLVKTKGLKEGTALMTAVTGRGKLPEFPSLLCIYLLFAITGEGFGGQGCLSVT